MSRRAVVTCPRCYGLIANTAEERSAHECPPSFGDRYPDGLDVQGIGHIPRAVLDDWPDPPYVTLADLA